MNRPKKEFATGARTLRGGKNHYTAKTLCGNWVEAQYDPEFEELARESKFDEKYQSTAAVDAADGIGSVAPPFGAGMEQYEREASDKAGQTTYNVSEWESVNASTFHLDESKTTEFVSKKHNVGGLSFTEGEAYRARWTSEGEGLRDRRFTTTNGAASTFHPEQFQTTGTRPIIGVPNGVTKLRKSLVIKHALNTAHELRLAFEHVIQRGNGAVVDQQELQDGLVSFLGGLKMTSGAPVLAEQQLGLAVGELESVFRFFDATSAGVISIQTFISTIIGEPKLERANLIRDTFQRLAQKSGDDINVGSLSNAATSFRQYYVGKNSKYWSRYVDSDGTLTMEKFLMFYGGVSCAVVADDSFAYTIAADWSGIADPLKTTSPYQRVKKVRVTMTNGESFEETLVVDTAASSDPSQLRTIYLARGIAVKSIRYLI
jgi:hypothetical protein